MQLIDARRKFSQQKNHAKKRGIEWQLTFDQWLAWWGADIDGRGVGRFELQMQRPCDVGPYALGNIRKGTPKDNGRTRSAVSRNKKAKLVVISTIFAEHFDLSPDDRPEANDLGYESLHSRYG